MKNKFHWSIILKKVVSELPSNQKIIFKGNTFCFKYVGYLENRMGFLMIWEVNSKRAIQVSRVKVPEGFYMVNIEDVEGVSKEIPNDLEIEEMD